MKPKKIKKNSYKLTVMVDRELFEKANAARNTPWPEIFNETLKHVIKVRMG